MEGTSITWIYMVPPLAVLAVNLLWPRRRSIQVAALIVLVLMAWLHGSPFGGMNSHHRALNAVERELAGKSALDAERAVSLLQHARAVADQTIFDLALGLTLGLVFAAIPPEALARIFSRVTTRKSSDAQPASIDRSA